MFQGYPPPTDSEIIICSFLRRAPYKLTFHCWWAGDTPKGYVSGVCWKSLRLLLLSAGAGTWNLMDFHPLDDDSQIFTNRKWLGLNHVSIHLEMAVWSFQVKMRSHCLDVFFRLYFFLRIGIPWDSSPLNAPPFGSRYFFGFVCSIRIMAEIPHPSLLFTVLRSNQLFGFCFKFSFSKDLLNKQKVSPFSLYFTILVVPILLMFLIVVLNQLRWEGGCFSPNIWDVYQPPLLHRGWSSTQS